MTKSAGALLFLPDGRLVMQRRTSDAPTNPGKLGFFGGAMEAGETPEMTIKRELAEETDLDVSSLVLVPAGDIIVTVKQAGVEKVYQGFLFRTNIPAGAFKIYEGAGAEVYTIEELGQQDDLGEMTRAYYKKYLEK